ncbi:class I SAM-dependent methyltransferase family protein [Candidatus Micrarchaeota archaeon]|nr:class I SAM-dependent methyltransferase family protein [Candidatus Micrarchaeota archaeon]
MKALKVKKIFAEKTKKKLINVSNYKIKNEGNYVYFPINENIDMGHGEIIEVDEGFFEKRKKPPNLKGYLKENGIELEFSAFEIIGDIAIVEIPEEFKKHEKTIADGIVRVHPQVKTVLKKQGGMEGVLRIRKMKHVLGEEKTETIYKENGCGFKVDVSKMFYSSKLSNERLRIAGTIRNGENILVPFAGYGPFAILFAKMFPKSKVVGIELNKNAVKYFEENIKLNKLKNIEILQGDAREKIEHFENWADRIVMPLPKDAVEYVGPMLRALKNKGVIHLYAFTQKEEPYKKVENQIKLIAKNHGYKVKFIFKRVVRAYSPTIVEVVLDVQCEAIK